VIRRKTAQGKTLSLFADDLTFKLGVQVPSSPASICRCWRTDRGRADCENRIKSPKADFGLDAFNRRDFWATEAALGFAMLAYNLMNLFRQAICVPEFSTRSLLCMAWCWPSGPLDAQMPARIA